MATFVSLVTCHPCPVASPRRGLIYADSLSALSKKWPPGNQRLPLRNHQRPPGMSQAPPWPPGPWPPGPCLPYRHPCRLTRSNVPGSFAVTGSGPTDSVRHLLVSHLRKLLIVSPAHHRRGLRLPG